MYQLDSMGGVMEAALSTVPLRVQEEVLLQTIEFCARMRDVPEDQFDVLSPEHPKIDL